MAEEYICTSVWSVVSYAVTIYSYIVLVRKICPLFIASISLHVMMKSAISLDGICSRAA